MKLALTILTFLLTINCFSQENVDSSTVSGPTLSTEQLDAFKTQAISSVTDLGTYINVMVDKSNSLDRRNKHVELAIKLFSNEENTVEVTSLDNKQKVIRKIRKYFSLVRDLPYQSVNITWYGIYLSSDFVKGPDGKYYGVASICQTFEAKTLNSTLDTRQWNVRNNTCKNIQLIVEEVKGFKGTDQKTVWILKLGDIKVDEQRTN